MIDSQPLISIIAPVYNPGEFFVPCLNSIIRQTYTNWELILIDDGSTDQSPSLCDAYAEQDCRITVIHQKNQGVSAARNHGIHLIHGSFVVFVDSDDPLEADYLETLLNCAEENHADIVCCNFTIVDENDNPITGHPRSYDGTFPNVREGRRIEDVTSVFSDIAERREYYWSHVTAALIRSELIKKCAFPPYKHYEDGSVFFDLCYLHPSIYLSPYAGYHYVMRAASASHAVSSYALRPKEDLVSLRCHEYGHLSAISHPMSSRFLELYADAVHVLAYTAAQGENRIHWKRIRGFLSEHISLLCANRQLLPRSLRLKLQLYRVFPLAYRILARLNESAHR